MLVVDYIYIYIYGTLPQSAPCAIALGGPELSAQGWTGLCPGKGAHKVEQPCARAGGAQGHAQGRTRTHKVAHKVTDRHPRTRSRKLNRAQGLHTLPGEQKAQGAHKVCAHMVMEQGSGQTAIYIYIYIYT